MSNFHNTHSIILSAATVSNSGATITAYTFCEVYATVAASFTLNGQPVTMAAGSTLPIKVRTISGTLTGVFLLGEKVNVSYDNPTLGF